MQTAKFVTFSTVKYAVGIGTSIAFVSTMDDIIYQNFKRNVILPFQMVTVKRSAGTLEAEDI